METSTTSQEMLRYFTQLTEAEQRSILEMVRTFLNAKNLEAAQTSHEYNQELEQHDNEIEQGDFVLHEDVIKRYSKP